VRATIGIYPRQNSLPSVEPMTSRPLAIAGDAVMGAQALLIFPIVTKTQRDGLFIRASGNASPD
jgi:hypothetical protein